jgi:hypothetical protein
MAMGMPVREYRGAGGLDGPNDARCLPWPVNA